MGSYKQKSPDYFVHPNDLTPVKTRRTTGFYNSEKLCIAKRLLPLVMLLCVILACVNSRSPRSNPTNSTPQADTAKARKENPWSYNESSDEMGRGRIYTASNQSTNTISLGFPYEGAPHGFLFIREHPQHGRDVYITIEKGQLLDSDYYGKVIVRFDEDKPLSFPSVRPADLSSETLFLRGKAFPTFISRLRTAKVVKIEVPVYQAGNQILAFDVKGFMWKSN